jgi:hypothetical protein
MKDAVRPRALWGGRGRRRVRGKSRLGGHGEEGWEQGEGGGLGFFRDEGEEVGELLALGGCGDAASHLAFVVVGGVPFFLGLGMVSGCPCGKK